jgi:murein DD-endopeptidase MepM/ murein hydrolase activator NlpD
MRRIRPSVRLRTTLLSAILVLPLLLSPSGSVPNARAGDPLQDALRAQKALQAKIASQKQRLSQLQADEAALNATLAATQRALAQINVDQGTARKNIANASAALKKVRAHYAELVAKVHDLDWQLQLMEEDLADGEQQLANSRALLASHIAEAYKTQQTSLLEQLLTADSLATVLADVGYYMHMGDADAQLAQQIQDDQASLERTRMSTQATRIETQQTRLAIFAEKANITTQRDALVRAKAQLDKLEKQTQDAKARQLATFNAVRRTKAATAATLADQQAALNKLKDRIDQLLNQAAVPSIYNGTLQWPMPGVVTQEFGCTGFPAEPPLGACAHFHTGIDIVADLYTPIRAAGDGVVLFVGPNPFDPPWARAWIVIIAHSQQLLTWYAHVDNAVHPPIVVQGQTVHQGDVIAYEGNTGNSTGPHLHWAVELNHQFANPRLFI